MSLSDYCFRDPDAAARDIEELTAQLNIARTALESIAALGDNRADEGPSMAQRALSDCQTVSEQRATEENAKHELRRAGKGG